MIKTWSFTKIHKFEQCKLKAKLEYDDKIPIPPDEPEIGETETKLARGIRLHKAAELYVQGTGEFDPELRKFRTELNQLRELFKQNKVSTEQMWALDTQWEPTTGGSGWGYAACDVVAKISPEHWLIIDYKTGRKWGNEIKHGEQLELYALFAFCKDEKLEKVTAEIWYLDGDEITSRTFKRDQFQDLFGKWNSRAVTMTNCTEFPPNPNIFSCRYCPYGKKGTGHCDKG